MLKVQEVIIQVYDLGFRVLDLKPKIKMQT